MKRKTIQITLGWGGTKIAIEADCFGIWAVHQRHKEPDWTVTHVPSGVGVCSLEREQAYAIAKRLHRYGVNGKYYGAESSHVADWLPQAKVDPDFRHQVEAVVGEELARESL